MMPDLTIILDLPVEAGVERLRRRGAAPDRFEGEPLERHRAIRDRFLALAAKEPGRFAVVDASADEDMVEQVVWSLVEPRFLPAKAPAEPAA